MRCAVCDGPCKTNEIRFFTGLCQESAYSLRKPWPCGEVWTIDSPVYYVAAPDFRSIVRPFCGAHCMLADHEARRS